MNIHPPIVSSPSQTNITKMMRNNQESQHKTKISRPNSHLSSTSSANKYNFKSNIDRSKKEKGNDKSRYKYNLYSALDSTLNTGCKKGCGDN